MTVLNTKLLATLTATSFPARGTPRLELCNQNQFSFYILLFLLLQIGGVALCFQWSCPEKKGNPFFPINIAVHRSQPWSKVITSASPQLGLWEHMERVTLKFCSPHANTSFYMLLHEGNRAKQMSLDSLTQMSYHLGSLSTVPLHG